MLTHTHSAGGGGDKAMMIPHTTLEMDKSTTHRGDRTHSMARAQSLRLIDSHTHTHTHSTEGTKSERKKDERERILAKKVCLFTCYLDACYHEPKECPDGPDNPCTHTRSMGKCDCVVVVVGVSLSRGADIEQGQRPQELGEYEREGGRESTQQGVDSVGGTHCW